MSEDEYAREIESLQQSKAAAEEAYERMYDTLTCHDAAWLYNIVTRSFHEALFIAEELNLIEEASAINRRLADIAADYRNCFRQPAEPTD